MATLLFRKMAYADQLSYPLRHLDWYVWRWVYYTFVITKGKKLLKMALSARAGGGSRVIQAYVIHWHNLP